MPENRYENPGGPVTPSPRPGQERYVAPVDEGGLGAVDAVKADDAPTSLWRDAWLQMRSRWLFWVSAVIIVLVVLVAAFPGLFTSLDPRVCNLAQALEPPQAGHPFGFDRQGCDIYTRTIYGARASVVVGVLATTMVVVLGTAIGAIAGYYGKWFDTILSRITDIFFAIPLVLAAIVIMSVTTNRTSFTVAFVLALFGWTQIARITRGTVLSVKNNEFVTAARSLGMGRGQILWRHVLPNSAAPIIVYATVALGQFIVAEATLSFLGIGLPPSTVSWGGDISAAQGAIRTAPEILLYPAGGLALTVLGFMMMGDVVRDALDPKARKR
ncbi:oligopeptide transport system permease protein [Isoptericola sp. CG 20/1183]|uniref:Oligopeptide transport system permease protein n=1 Tax=Isoptericola halotolerans TaxID=300560 RepID=A0ABX5EF83_9MICO|nr:MULTISPECIES: ABC transporter permease [Isoptericola]MCK0116864.1 ABC transporter permease [Isoptericola sp. S6320L]PRZ07762.1 oligopeptide transport system permease protein [Isoptericola halotolerans]PRZ07879.1 oligopeptide transport system permease protein [Isoptericola sp. CG 20/1183]